MEIVQKISEKKSDKEKLAEAAVKSPD